MSSCHRRGEEPPWTSTRRFRALLRVDARREARYASVVEIELDLGAQLRGQGVPEPLDDGSIEVVAYDDSARPRVYDESRAGREEHLLPWGIRRLYPLERLRLSFVVPPGGGRLYAVYFDTTAVRPDGAPRYPGLVGDGDVFREEHGRREVAANAHDAFVDLDGDGDLDLVKGGSEPFLYVYENVGANRYVERGPLTSAGEPLLFPHDEGNRSWLSPEFFDWDGDGDLDVFVTFYALPHKDHVVAYENTTTKGGPLTFVERNALATVSGRPLTDRIHFVDWDGDGKTDVLSSADGLLAFHRNLGGPRGMAGMRLADATYIEANGAAIQLGAPQADCADIDGDGDLDVFVGTEDGRVFFFENVGTRRRPVLSAGRLLVYNGYMDAKARVTVADFTGDGLLDLVVGRYWERVRLDTQPRVFGRLYRNVGTRVEPRFEERDAGGGAPHVEGFLACDAGRQNGLRAADWDGDGKLDLLAADSDGYVWFFRNTTGAVAPIFEPPVRLSAGGRVIRVLGAEPQRWEAGYARLDVADWNNDSRLDLLVADGRGFLWLFLGDGSRREPRLAPGRRVEADGRAIDGTGRASVLVTDWNRDGRKDVVFAMAGEEPTANADWPTRNADPASDRGFLFYRNIGSDEAPVLARPDWIRAGTERSAIDFLRASLGDFADWDGDGRPDFVACDFEQACWLFVNAANGARRPRFPDDGVRLLEDFTEGMISGADAVDWDGDGALDLLSGQGHAGSSIRYYRHGYLEDRLRGSTPRVTFLRAERRPAP